MFVVIIFHMYYSFPHLLNIWVADFAPKLASFPDSDSRERIEIVASRHDAHEAKLFEGEVVCAGSQTLGELFFLVQDPVAVGVEFENNFVAAEKCQIRVLGYHKVSDPSVGGQIG